MSWSLVLLNGAYPGTTLRLDPERPDPVTIGRHPTRDLPLDDDRASRLHAEIFHRSGSWHLRDADSLNGTFVNTQPIKQGTLEAGDLVRIGDHLILFAESSGGEEPSSLKPELLHPTTMMGRLPIDDPHSKLVEQKMGRSASRVVRDSAVLCRVANLLHESQAPAELVRCALDALVDGVDPDAVSIWLAGTDGRLRCAASWGKSRDEHVLASLAVEQDKAILIDKPQGSEDQTVTDAPLSVGTGIGVPIPGRSSVRGAIECHRQPERDPFARSDLDFAVVVAHQMGAALENVEHRERLEQANEELKRRLDSKSQMAGSSEAMQRVLDQVARVGPTSSNVLVLGESGTGKELVAQSIHELSERKDGPYVTVNCAAFSESLLESELFGHEVGTFTGADRRHIGQFERAHRGTIFLDEVGEMSLACQAKLLRILEGHPFQRLGGEESIKVDVRVVAATHRDLVELVGQKEFREDLYFRLRVIDIQMPPLRERADDVIELASLFLEHFRAQLGRGPQRFSREAVEGIRSYRWPGNVRELRNAIERAIVLGRGDEVTVEDLGMPVHQRDTNPTPQLMSVREAERRHIHYVLEQVGGNKTKACRILEIGRGTLYNKLDAKGE
ncbi:MAG: sigma 54-interacting transcriptional regulator [Pirellulaceae bacterium]|jgi:Nif-specific regulatory protein|nr:sigma 54-interacting transcriptional regulator [Pirellulaceae bacterium]